jgi:GT2 family glycosyltransferase/glycosyltransferase involved in cell wall biosynthesis
MTGIKIDIVVPVYNSLQHVRACLESLKAALTPECHLILLDDASYDYVGAEAAKLASEIDCCKVTVSRNPKNQGYLRTCNLGLSLGSAEIVIFLNSDTQVFPGTFERILRDFQSDPKIGVVNPVSNWANWTRVPFPAGSCAREVFEKLRNFSSSGQSLPDIYNASGFFFAVKRELIERLGGFDPELDPGYWEEADLCMKILRDGSRVVVDPWLFVYHHGWGSFGEEKRNEHMTRNRQIFMSRWKNEFERYERLWKVENPLARTLEILKDENFSDAPAYELAIGKTSARFLLDSIQEQGVSFNFEPWFKREKGGRVIYILPALGLYGGIVSVIQIVNRLIQHGIDANIATFGSVDEDFLSSQQLLFRPFVFSSEEELIGKLAPAEIIVATHWTTAYTSLALHKLHGSKLLYFVQDFEPEFYVDSEGRCTDQKKYQLAEQTYKLLPKQIVKSQWLEQRLKDYGGEVYRIPLGLNTDVFFDYGLTRKRQILAMARPHSAYRNFKMLLEVYRRLSREQPDLELAVYGWGYRAEDFDFPVTDYGKLDSPERVARVLNESMVLLDPSIFQGFGRPGLEAMACGTAAVLTRRGGIIEYARHESNCLLIDPGNPEEIVNAVRRMSSDTVLRDDCIATGKTTVQSFSYLSEGAKTAEVIRSMLSGSEDTPAEQICRESFAS